MDTAPTIADELERLAHTHDVARVACDGGMVLAGRIAGVNDTYATINTNLGTYGEPEYHNVNLVRILAVTEPVVVSADRWARTSGDYKLGSPSKGDARMLMLEDDGVTRLVPVTVA